MAELVKVRPSVFGVLDQEAEISTQVTREENGTYSPLSCWEDLYTLRNGTIAHEDQVIVHSTRAGATHWRIESRRCIDLPGYDPACYPENAFHVISDQPVRDVDLITTGTGNNRTAAIQDCPGRTVEGQSCKTSFGSETCINWTATIPARYTGNLIKGK